MPELKPFIFMLAETKNNRWYPVLNMDIEHREVTLAVECGRATYPIQWIRELSIMSSRPIRIVPQ